VFKEGNGHRKLTPPGKVMAYTSDYKEDNDAIAKFLREKIHVPQALAEGEERASITWTSVQIMFNEWKRTNDVQRFGVGASGAELKKRLEAAHGKVPSGGWTSFRLGDA
jgi:phage/plasmid-associated DNA primase